MKLSHLFIALFSLGLVSVSCGKKKKAEEAAPAAVEQPAAEHGHDHGDHGHDHGDHGHDHGDHGHDH